MNRKATDQDGALSQFRLKDQVAVITGGAGFLGRQHAEVIAEAGGIPILWDVNADMAKAEAATIERRYHVPARAMKVDITNSVQVRRALKRILEHLGRPQILINNAANDPKIDSNSHRAWSRLEHFPLPLWERDLAVGLTGAFLCSQIIGSHMAANGGGVLLNVASDLSLIAPDQRIYRLANRPEALQPAKPVTYSVVKHALIGLTRYLATYWADKNVRVNAISPGGVYRDQPEAFVRKLTDLIPMGRMAKKDEYKGAVLFLVSNASSYMTGANLIIDGGRTCW
jgi:NAD(P)-dependent dehydrogenase (short-subunit alcohol dehydrogenase family)